MSKGVKYKIVYNLNKYYNIYISELMSYYILPKINNTIIVEPESSGNFLSPYISHSLFNYYNEVNQQIMSNCFSNNVSNNVTNNVTENDLSYNKYDELIKIVNPYEYIFSTVPGSKFSVSKLKPKSNVFYDFLEVSMTLNVFDLYKKPEKAKKYFERSKE